MTITIDGTQHRDQYQLHAFLKKSLEFPDYYGMNLDALWDCMNGWVEYPMSIHWINYNASLEYLGEYASKVSDLFRGVQAQGFELTFDTTP